MDIRYIISLLILLSLAGIAAAVPVLPDEFGGSVTLDGEPAPAGTAITARIDWNERGSTVTTKAGEYGPLDSPGALAVRATESDLLRSGSPNITFWVNGNKADQEVTFIGGTVRQLDLSATTRGGGDSPEPIASQKHSFDLDGVTTTVDDAGMQQVSIEKAKFLDGDIRTNETAIILSKGGWDELILFTEGKPDDGDLSVGGTVKSVHAQSNWLDAPLGKAQIDLTMNQWRSDAAFTMKVLMPDPAVADAISEFVRQKKDQKIEIAYVLEVAKSGVEDISSAIIRMTVSSEWVDDVGGEKNVVILRQADDGEQTRLTTRHLPDPENAGNIIFVAESPGFSTFALVAAKDTGSSNGGSGGSGGGGGGGSSKDSGSQFTYDPDTQATPTMTAVATATPDEQPTSAAPETQDTPTPEQKPVQEPGSAFPTWALALVVVLVVALVAFLVMRKK